MEMTQLPSFVRFVEGYGIILRPWQLRIASLYFSRGCGEGKTFLLALLWEHERENEELAVPFEIWLNECHPEVILRPWQAAFVNEVLSNRTSNFNGVSVQEGRTSLLLWLTKYEGCEPAIGRLPKVKDKVKR